ncbi:tetratricopeptide repeat protein [Vampirovibrio chlorellavorus]|uniref:tetratricopeptide repeat protein n=1 Tax=Vampirovibrio chlorellavorus TaxID=758823 RepID=UPI0026F28918|nr:tetratricopeptide repeat protein [Vampirovibrio chlorellavorus]
MLSGFGWAFVAAVWADLTSQVTDIQLTPSGNLTFTVNGTGFDPQLLVRPVPQGRYQITIASREARLNGPRERLLAEQIQARIPAIESILLSGDETGFQLNLTSWQKLQPQILSNSPGQIVVTLVGNHQRPPHSPLGPAPQSQPQSVPSAVKSPARPQAAVKPSGSVRTPTKPQSAKTTPPQSSAEGAVGKSAPAPESGKKESQRALPVKAATGLKEVPPTTAASVVATPFSATFASATATPSSAAPVSPVSASVKKADPGKRQPVVAVAPSPVKVESVIKRASAPLRVASIAPKALETDWLPRQRPSARSRLSDNAPSQHPLEALNFLSQGEPAKPTAPGTPLTPANPSTQPQSSDTSDRPEPVPLRLQKTPAGYDLPITLSGQADAVSQSVYSLHPLNEYSVFQEPTLQRAADDVRNGRLDNAEITLQGFLAREPNHSQANYLLALIYLSPASSVSAPTVSPGAADSSRQQQARRLLETLQARQPHGLVYQQLIGLALTQNQPETASGLLKEALRQFPDNAWLWYQQGRVLEEGKQWEAAKSAYTQALALDDNHPEYLYRLALMHLQQENRAACAQTLNRALAIAPDDARFLKLMGYLSEKQAAPSAAAHYYQAALQTDVMLYYGRLLQHQKRTAEALSFYRAVESVAENDPDLLLSLGTLYTEANAPQRAQTVLKRLIQLVPDPRDPRQGQAKAMLRQARN